jgi:hypothetical protein
MANNFKEAVVNKTRVQTPKGALSAEQLCELSIPELDGLAVELEEAYKESGKKSFVTKSSAKSKEAKHKFDLVLEILQMKVEEQEIAAEKLENKQHNERILELIAGKQDEELKGLSIAELKKKLK